MSGESAARAASARLLIPMPRMPQAFAVARSGRRYPDPSWRPRATSAPPLSRTATVSGWNPCSLPCSSAARTVVWACSRVMVTVSSGSTTVEADLVSGPPGQPQYRDQPRRLRLVLPEAGALGDRLRPDLVALGPGELLGMHRERLGAHLDGELRVGLHVVVPVRVRRRPTLGRDDHHGSVVLREVDERRHPLRARLRADVMDEDHRRAVERAAHTALVRSELVDDALIPAVPVPQRVSSQRAQKSSTQTAATTAPPASNQNNPAHIPPGKGVSRASMSASELPCKPRRRPRCSSRTARSPPNTRNQHSAAANPSCRRGSPHPATTATRAPVASTASAP